MRQFQSLRNLDFTPVPNFLLGPTLGSIDDIGELKCILRAIWYIFHDSESRDYVTIKQLAADPIIVRYLRQPGSSVANNIEILMKNATKRGIFTSTRSSSEENLTLYKLNADLLPKDRLPIDALPDKPSIFSIYEENIGIITPLIAEDLKDAAKEYNWEWIREAFKIAVSRNRRNWRYISRILERWATEGKEDGKFGRHTEKSDRKRYLAEYLEEGRRLPNS